MSFIPIKNKKNIKKNVIQNWKHHFATSNDICLKALKKGAVLFKAYLQT